MLAASERDRRLLSLSLRLRLLRLDGRLSNGRRLCLSRGLVGG